MLKLKLQYFGHQVGRTDSLRRPWCWERLRAGKEGDDRGWDGWMASPTRCTWVEETPGVGEGQGGRVCCSPWGRKGWRWLSDWTELRWQVDNSICVSVQFSTVTQSCPTLCDPMDYSTSGFTVLHHLVEFAQTHVHWVGDAIHHLIPCCPLFHLPSIFPASGSSPLSQMLQSIKSPRPLYGPIVLTPCHTF